METATQLLHRVTSYEPGRDWDGHFDHPQAVKSFKSTDVDHLPWFFKRYAEPMTRVELPRALPTTNVPAIAVLAGTAKVPEVDLSLEHLSRLLHLSGGIVRTGERSYGTFFFRAAGSAGGRFPLELYVAVPEGTSLPPGVHWYHPHEHALIEIGPPPRGQAPAIVVTGVPWRTGWRYRERGYRHIYWDAGTMLAQLLTAAASAGIQARLLTLFPDATVGALAGVDGVHEFPVAVVGLGSGDPALDASGAAATGDVDAAPVEFPLVTAAQRAGDRNALGDPWDEGKPVPAAVTATEPVETVILARGSMRRMDPTRGLAEPVFRTALDVSLRGATIPHRVVVHDVDGLEPGLYRWPDLSTPVRSGLMRDELYRVCLDQGLPRDAAFVVIAAADVGALDDREYRDAHLVAGLVEGRLHLAAYALGAGASGMTFVDGAIPSLLGERLDGLLFTCVGVPEYATTPGGLPGAPAKVRTPAARVDDQE